MSPDEISLHLAQRTRIVSTASGRAASVLIPLSDRAGETHVLVIKRTETLAHHGGQYALPGGGREPHDESPIDTALREAHEEVGIVPSDVRVLGMLDELTTHTNFVVTPVVGWIPHPYPFELCPAEVALAVELPLLTFAEPPRARTLAGDGPKRLVLSFEVEGHFIWGLTARILRDLLSIIRPAAE